MLIKYLICENCKQVVARFDLEAITLPLMSDQFESKFPPERCVRSPWYHPVKPIYMRCPMCPKRVFNDPEPENLWISDSMDGLMPYFWPIPKYKSMSESLEKVEACPKCGRLKSDFKAVNGFVHHVSACGRKRGRPAEELINVE